MRLSHPPRRRASPCRGRGSPNASDPGETRQELAIDAGATRIDQKRAFRSRSAFEITDTELKLIAAAAMIGLSSSPKNG
jgi:hypothetical protein